MQLWVLGLWDFGARRLLGLKASSGSNPTLMKSPFMNEPESKFIFVNEDSDQKVLSWPPKKPPGLPLNP